MSLDPLYIQSGWFRSPITIQSPSGTIDNYGQPSQTWDIVLTTRANIQAITMREMAQESSLISQVTHIIKVRYPGNDIRIVTGDRVKYGTQVFVIQAIDNVQFRNRLLRLQCIAIDAASTAGDING